MDSDSTGVGVGVGVALGGDGCEGVVESVIKKHTVDVCIERRVEEERTEDNGTKCVL